MRIELADKAHWAGRVQEILDHIEATRAARDAQYEAEWLQGSSGFLWWKKPRTGKPPRCQSFDIPASRYYPSLYGCGVKHELECLLLSLIRDTIGAVWIDGDEFNTIAAWWARIPEDGEENES